MDLDLGIPRGVLESLPDDDGAAEQDIRRAVAGYRQALEGGFAAADDEAAAATVAVDFLENAEDRADTYDEFVPELTAWGQSPIHAVAWLDLYFV